MGASILVEDGERLIGAVLGDPSVIIDASDIRSTDFVDGVQRAAWDTILKISNDGRMPSRDEVCDALRAAGQPSTAAQIERIHDRHGNQHPDRVKTAINKIRNNGINQAMAHIADQIKESPLSGEQLLSSVMGMLQEASARIKGGSTVAYSKIAREEIERAIRIYKEEEVREAVMTGFPTIDRYLNGLVAGETYIIGARPSEGKTALALNIATNVARSGKRVLFFSLETTAAKIAHRVVSSLTGVNGKFIASGYLSPRTIGKLLGHLDRNPIGDRLVIDDSSSPGITDIMVRTRREQMRSGVDLVMIDYLQLMASSPDDTKELSKISRGLKVAAKDLGVPMVIIAQLNRDVDKRDPPRPRKSDLRSSGQIEQDAQAALLIWTPNEQDKSQKSIVVAKNKDGDIGEFGIGYTGDTVTFSDELDPLFQVDNMEH